MTETITAPFRKAIIVIAGDFSIQKCDVIELDGEFWLVPTWIVSPDGRQQRPERIVRLKWLVSSPPNQPDHDFVVDGPIPRDVMYGPLPHAAGPQYDVRGLPDAVLTSPPPP